MGSEKLGARFELPLAVLDTLQVKLSICLDTIKVMSNDGPTSKNNPMQQTAMFLNGTNFTTWLVQNDGLRGSSQNALITTNHSILN